MVRQLGETDAAMNRKSALSATVVSRAKTPTRLTGSTTKDRIKEVAEDIRRRLLHDYASGAPKYIQLRRAVLDAVEDNVLKPGDQLPPEDMLTEVLAMSLGTIRRALEHLATGGVVVREPGRGTFVSEHHKAMHDTWHFRFITEDGSRLLPAYSHVIERSVIKESGPWATHLGADSNGFVRIKRSFSINEEFLCYGEFYLRSSRFGGFMRLPSKRMESVNLKRILAEEFGAPILYVVQRVRVDRLPGVACEIMGIREGRTGMCVQIVAYSYDDAPISFHWIYVPPTHYMLEFSDYGPEEATSRRLEVTS